MDKKSAKLLNIDSEKLNEKLTIPKHRFDCVNIALKETKLALKEKISELEEAKRKITNLENAVIDAKVDVILAVNRAKNFVAVKALITFSELKLGADGNLLGLDDQIIRLKNTQSYLFEDNECTTYILVPVKKDAPVDKSIIKQIIRTEKIK